ncbi:Gfo/Idh/MocA family protein [Prochlorococcus sp. MIT 1011]|uniref:Gfo/Idh/MocA family protein n=1 Tax=Prochlorococcus sp. MIT 1011 TaxID=3082520 RepID=UPI0039B62A79
MSLKIKIYGAGSIGNHLANASRRLNWEVDICDIDTNALSRTKEHIYPSRYNVWDKEIGLYLNDSAPKKDYDLIIIGTPPDVRNKLALQSLKEKPKAILIEKPAGTPDLKGLKEIFKISKKEKIKVFIGYDHVVGKSVEFINNLIDSNLLGNIETLDVEFRENWSGIFKAHPWLEGPSDSYLGFWERGGGACSEHSHALNLWQHFAHKLGGGKVKEVNANLEYVTNNNLNYDKIALVNLKTENGLLGRVVQDVVTIPTIKKARIQGDLGYINWICNSSKGADEVSYGENHGSVNEEIFNKSRPDDFIAELTHINNQLSNTEDSSISIEKGFDTMLLIAACHKSALEKRSVNINYNSGYIYEALY